MSQQALVPASPRAHILFDPPPDFDDPSLPYITSVCGRYTIMNLVSRGLYSLIYFCYDNYDDEMRALKVIRRPEYRQTADRQQNTAKAEYRLHMRVSNHRNICSVYGLLQRFPDGYMLMDLCRMDLQELIHYCHSSFTPFNIKRLFLDIVDAVIHCHWNGLAHRNLSSDNVGIIPDDYDGADSAVLLDFGAATMALSSRKPVFTCGVEYCAPEFQVPSPPPAPVHNWAAADLWSLGILLFEMITGEFPFNSSSQDLPIAYQIHKRDNGLQKRFPGISTELDEILGTIFTESPSTRVCLEQLRSMVLNCPNFYSDMDKRFSGSPHPRDLRLIQMQRPDKVPDAETLNDMFMGVIPFPSTAVTVHLPLREP